jgi:hypothetical protein
LREFSAIHIDENCENLTGFHENALFYNCTFRNLRGLTLKDCVLTKSKFLTDKVEDALGFTISIGDCLSFADVEYSPLLFDMNLLMLIKTAGNTEKREALIKLLGRDRVHELLTKFKSLER